MKKILKCKKCGESSIECHSHRKYCNSCYEKMLEQDFMSTVSKNDNNVLRYYFDKESEYSARQHVSYYCLGNDKEKNMNTWQGILRKYGKYDIYVDKCVELYVEYCNNNKDNNTGTNEFIKSTPIINGNDICEITVKTLKEKAGMAYLRYSDEEFIENFTNIYNKYKRVPTYVEFENETNISFTAYKLKYGTCKERGLYGNIVFNILGEYFYGEYKKSKLKIRKYNIHNIPNILENKYSDSELLDIINNYVKKSYNKYGVLPSRRLFEKDCKKALKTYRTRFNKTWVELLLDMGYKLEEISKNTSETQCLGRISDILKSKYEPQKQFDWLIGNKNYPLFCDGYFEEYNLVVEFQGRQHYVYKEKAFGDYESFLNQIKNDEVKRDLIPKNGIKLIEIKSASPWYKEDWLRKLLEKNGIKIKD